MPVPLLVMPAAHVVLPTPLNVCRLDLGLFIADKRGLTSASMVTGTQSPAGITLSAAGKEFGKKSWGMHPQPDKARDAEAGGQGCSDLFAAGIDGSGRALRDSGRGPIIAQGS